MAKVSPSSGDFRFHLLSRTERQTNVNNPCFVQTIQLEFDDSVASVPNDDDDEFAQQMSTVDCPAAIQPKVMAAISGQHDVVVMFSVFDSNEVYIYFFFGFFLY